MRAYLAQTRAELTMSLRQGEQLLVTIGIPLLVLVFFSMVDVLPKADAIATSHLDKSQDPIRQVADTIKAVDSLTPGVIALAIMSTAMVSLGIGTGFERYYRVLKRIGSTPLGRHRLIAAKITMVLAIEVLQLAILVPAALLLGWNPGGEFVYVVPAIALGTAAFAGIGLLLAGTLRGPANLAVCNALYLVLLLFGGVVIPVDRLPAGLREVAGFLPSGALSNVMHHALIPRVATPTTAWAVLFVWALVMPFAAREFFRWE